MANNCFVLILVPLGIICFISLLFSHMDKISRFMIDKTVDPLPKEGFGSHFSLEKSQNATKTEYGNQEQNRIQENEKEIFRKQEAVYKERKRSLQKICSQYKMTNGVSEVLLERNILFHPQYEDTMNVPDAISDLWHGKLDYYMRLFYLLPQELTYKEKLLLLNNSLKITFVRHPFVRLVSSYQDKVLEHNHNNWRQKILKKSSIKKVIDGKPNFDQFIDFAIETVLDNQEHGERIDNHLNFYWNKCDMCNMHYDVIGKTETADEDLKYIFSKLKKANFQLPAEEQKHRSKGGSSDEKALNYFSMIKKSKTKQLYEVYKKDFLMFNYDPTPFFKASRND